MGLDMYLMGRRYNPQHEVVDGKYVEKERPVLDGFEVQENVLEIGYWRKHRRLHGFIVENYGGGEDDCRPIMLSPEDLHQIADALDRYETDIEALPETEGFFFGNDDWDRDLQEQAPEHAARFRKAAAWLSGDDNSWNHVEYQSSW